MTESTNEGSVSVRSSSPCGSESGSHREMGVSVSEEGANTAVPIREGKELYQEMGELNENTWFEIGNTKIILND